MQHFIGKDNNLAERIDESYKDIYINGIGIEPIPIKDDQCKPYEEFRIYIKERTPELKRAFKSAGISY